MEKIINEHQRRELSGRIAKIGLMFASKSFFEANAEQKDLYQKLATQANAMANNVMKMGDFSTMAQYDIINGMIDRITGERDANGYYVMPYAVLDAIDAVLKF